MSLRVLVSRSLQPNYTAPRLVRIDLSFRPPKEFLPEIPAISLDFLRELEDWRIMLFLLLKNFCFEVEACTVKGVEPELVFFILLKL